MAEPITTLSVVWEECINEELCIHVPIIGKKCVHIIGCVRLVSEKNQIYIEVEAFGKRWKYEFKSACHKVFKWGIASLRLCIKTTDTGVQVVFEGCLGVDSVGKCWNLIAQDISLFKVSELSGVEKSLLNIEAPEFSALQNIIMEERGAISARLTDDQILETLTQE